ncbi:hypothetical protein ZWY2020_046999 [Hordeum vulgare]|nr:hypothetical protein ZWY2020_046999 [Hordeum vulgare]
MPRRPPACYSSALKVRKDCKPRHKRRRRERRRSRSDDDGYRRASPSLPPLCGYIVLNMPWAFVQWLQQAKIEEEYIPMAEPDHIFVKPLPNLAFDNDPAAFPFFYITPSEHEKIIRKYYPEERGPITNVDPIGCR